MIRILYSIGVARTFNRNQECLRDKYTTNLFRWWRGHGGEWIVGGPVNGTGVLFYKAAGDKSHPPSSGWTDSEGNAVRGITISSSRDLQNNTEDVFCDGMDGKLLDLDKSDNRVCDGTTWHQGGRTGTES